MNTSEQHKPMQGSCLLDLFLLPVSSDHTDFIMEYNKIARAKELLIKTKSRSRKGEQQKNPQNMHAEYHYNPALQNLQCLILGLTDLTLKI